ncbi:hypothetical protein ACFC1R_31485 [Kitasatospora sp. NPDC056138]|uniref:hypothetical protein n=1 Tax=Kitasatospora sp. NPDC056138 TaxID=3345724 RepID=UPI0035DF50F5
MGLLRHLLLRVAVLVELTAARHELALLLCLLRHLLLDVELLTAVRLAVELLSLLALLALLPLVELLALRVRRPAGGRGSVLLPALLLRVALLTVLGLSELLALLVLLRHLLRYLLPGSGLLLSGHLLLELLDRRLLLLSLTAVPGVAWVPRLRALGLVAPAQISHRTPYTNRQDGADRVQWRSPGNWSRLLLEPAC